MSGMIESQMAAKLPRAPTKGTASRLLPLDVLRAVAVLLVLGNHMPHPPEELTEWIRKPMRLWQHAGWIGVDLFFVLSGFLVAGLLLREQHQHGQMRVGRFLIRRGLKIYPALYFLVAVTVAGWAIQGTWPEPHRVLGELVFLQNYWGALWGHTWSLAVEEHFYLSLPVLLLTLLYFGRGKADPFRPLPIVFLVFATLLLGLRIHKNLFYEYRPGSHLLVTHLRADGLLFGVLLSYWYHFHAEAFVRWFKRWGRPALVVGVLVCGPLLLLPHGTFAVVTLGLTLIYLTAGALLCLLLVNPFPVTALTRAGGYMGTHSYSIYLWHYPMMMWGVPLMHKAAGTQLPWAVVTPAYMVLSVALGIGMAKLVEFPVLKLRDRLFPSLSRPLAGVAISQQQGAAPDPEPAFNILSGGVKRAAE